MSELVVRRVERVTEHLAVLEHPKAMVLSATRDSVLARTTELVLAVLRKVNIL